MVELGADAPFLRREHVHDDARRTLALELEGADCREPSPHVDAQAIGLHVQRDAVGSALSIVLDAGSAYTLARWGSPPRFALDVGAPLPPRDTRIVVLDPAHGGADRGARGEDDEADVTLDIARRAATWIGQYDPQVRVVLTRDSDTRLPTEQRMALANALGADAFVSIHAEGADPGAEEGATTFVFDPRPDATAVVFVGHEQGASAGGGGVTLLVGEREQAVQSERARGLAEAVHNRVVRAARPVRPGFANRGLGRAALHVLVGARMPAIVVAVTGDRLAAHAGAGPALRDAVAEGIARGLVRHFAPP